MYDREERPPETVVDGDARSPPPQPPPIPYEDEEEDMSDGESNININDEIANNAIANMDVSEEEEFGEVNGEKDEEEDVSNEEEDFEDDKKEGEMMNRAKMDLMSQLPHLFPFLPNNNVTIEPLPATKAAVAQFAENNMMPQDVAVMSATLYNLQQQQLVQLQLIQQLQQQLMSGMTPPSPAAMMALINQHAIVPTLSTPPTPKVDRPKTPEPVGKEGEVALTTQKEVSTNGDSSVSRTSPPVVSSSLMSTPAGTAAVSKIPKETALPATSAVPPTPSSPEFRHRGTSK